LLDRGDDIVSVHISAGISGTADAARQAAEQLEREGRGGERIHVVDSTTTAGGLGIVALAGARAAEAGMSAAEVEARILETRADLKIWFAIDTLEFLKRGGRIGAASAWIGSTLRVKPILTIESELVPVERVRTSSRMLQRMIDYAKQRHDSGADAWVVQHVSAREEAEKLAAACREVFGCEPLFVSEVGPVLSAHIGPGMLGVGSVPKSMFE
jgi:DegV family protein with EDD domain